jgi:hypothetical protein
VGQDHPFRPRCYRRARHGTHGIFRAHTVDARSAYVAISRARSGAALYTDSRARLTDALGLRDGAQLGALDQTIRQGRDGAAIGMA